MLKVCPTPLCMPPVRNVVRSVCLGWLSEVSSCRTKCPSGKFFFVKFRISALTGVRHELLVPCVPRVQKLSPVSIYVASKSLLGTRKLLLSCLCVNSFYVSLVRRVAALSFSFSECSCPALVTCVSISPVCKKCALIAPSLN